MFYMPNRNKIKSNQSDVTYISPKRITREINISSDRKDEYISNHKV